MKRLFQIIVGIVPAMLFGQMQEKQHNHTSFDQKEPVITEEMLSMIPEEYHDHPELGTLPYNSPCENCFELIHKRTDSTKLYVKKGTNGTHFFSQATYGVVHFERDDVSLTYDPRLKLISQNYYESSKQETPTFLDINLENAGFKIDGKKFTFNNELELFLQQNNGSQISMGLADWSERTIGEEGIRIIDAWEGIDITISYSLDRIKTNYVIKEELSYLSNIQKIIFKDRFVLPADYEIIEDSASESIDSDGNRVGDYLIKNEHDMSVFRIKKAFCYDKSGIKSRTMNLPYELNDGLDILLPTSWIKSDSAQFPLIIDPLVSSIATFTAGNMSFRWGGDFCGGPNGNCGYNLTVPRPANSTLTNANFVTQYNTDAGFCSSTCWMSDAGFQLEGPCGSTGFFSCNLNAPGSCTPPPGGSDVPGLISCLPPACSGGVAFTMRNSYCYCSFGGNCGFNCQSMPNGSWSITLEGRTVETLGNSTTGNGFSAVVATSCAGSATTTLDPTPEYGVPGYSFNWNTGETTPTIDITNPSTGDIFTADVTDACGNTVTATFEITCPLAVDLLDFTAENMDEQVVLNWSTASERDNDYFEVLRSTNGETFESIGKVQGAGNASTKNYYSFIDNDPHKGLNYYKLRIVDFDGVEEFSSTVSVERFSNSSSILCVPNPANEDVDIIFNYPEDDEYELEIIDMMGRTVHREINFFKKGKKSVSVNVRSLRSGTYKVQIITANQVHSSRLIVQ